MASAKEEAPVGMIMNSCRGRKHTWEALESAGWDKRAPLQSHDSLCLQATSSALRMHSSG